MTRTARYNAETNTFRELPGMEKPDDILQDGFFDSTYEKEMQEYRNHLASLRTIPCHESCRSVFKDQGVYEEGKGYELKKWCQDPDMCSISSCDCKEFACPVPARSEDEERKLWIEAIQFAVGQMAEDPFTPNGWFNGVKQKYKLTKR